MIVVKQRTSQHDSSIGYNKKPAEAGWPSVAVLVT